MVEIEWLRAEIDATVAYGKFAGPVAGDSPVLVAGDKEKAKIASRSAEGIEVNDEAWEEMHQLASQLT